MPVARTVRYLVLFAALMALAGIAQADEPGRTTNATPVFVVRAFDGAVPAPSVLWLTPAIKAQARRILGHDPGGLRLRYWRKGDKTAWILKETGKEEPITAGFVVAQGHLRETLVLDYRESRGWEIRYPYFLDQFANAKLDESLKLDRHIDGISGATLSVRAMQHMARLALYLDSEVQKTP